MNLKQFLELDGLPDVLDQLGQFVIENPHDFAGVPIFFFLQAVADGSTHREALAEVIKNFGGGDAVPPELPATLPAPTEGSQAEN